jgi:hypothetical protein
MRNYYYAFLDWFCVGLGVALLTLILLAITAFFAVIIGGIIHIVQGATCGI